MTNQDATVFDKHACQLGEGIFWHPDRQAPFWFDIMAHQLITCSGGDRQIWTFEEPVSAAAVVDADRLVIAGARGLFLFDLTSATQTRLVDFPHNDVAMRSNDGRCDPWGGFWIGTMGRTGGTGAGTVYRYIDGHLTPLFERITIPNAICFSPDRHYACFTDTPTRRIMRVALDAAGWPTGAPEVHIDLTATDLNPDGAVMDAEGCLWVAQWGHAEVTRYSPQGHRLGGISIPATNATCPAFGGATLGRLFVTSASAGLEAATAADGRTYAVDVGVSGQPENRIMPGLAACG